MIELLKALGLVVALLVGIFLLAEFEERRSDRRRRPPSTAKLAAAHQTAAAAAAAGADRAAERIQLFAYEVPFAHDHICPNIGCCVPCLLAHINPCCLDGAGHAVAINHRY